jgi:hypothetical protein
MKRADPKDHLPVDFAVESFDSAPRLLLRAAELYFGNFPFIAGVTLAIFLPAKLALQLVCWAMGVSTAGLTMYLLLDVSDLVLSSLAAPAIIYGLVWKWRRKALPPWPDALRWGRRQWGRTLWNKFKVEITVTLWGALLLVPGIVKMVQLAFTDQIIAIEADMEGDPLGRSRDVASGHGWRIFFVMLPLMAVELAGSYFILGAFHGPATSPLLIAAVDSLLSVGGQAGTVVILLMYLGLRGRD